jgi:hypothetical protein
MSKEEKNDNITPEDTIEEQVRDQTGQTKVRVRIDESSIKTSYASGFRPAATPEEVVLDFGMNITRMTGQKEVPFEVVFKAENRIVMNYYAIKRLAIALSQLVRKYEEQFGELELNASKRKKS